MVLGDENGGPMGKHVGRQWGTLIGTGSHVWVMGIKMGNQGGAPRCWATGYNVDRQFKPHRGKWASRRGTMGSKFF